MLQKEDNGTLQQATSVDAELVKEEGVSPVDTERGQMLQTAQVVVNMLDVTLLGTLAEEQKERVMLTNYFFVLRITLHIHVWCFRCCLSFMSSDVNAQVI